MACSCSASKKVTPVKQVTKKRIPANAFKSTLAGSTTSNGRKIIRRTIGH